MLTMPNTIGVYQKVIPYGCFQKVVPLSVDSHPWMLHLLGEKSSALDKIAFLGQKVESPYIDDK